MTFREKSLWLVGLSLVLVFGLYFWWVLPAPAPNVLPNQVVLFALMIALLVVLQIVGHTLIALLDRRVEQDERDRLITLIGERNGGFVLGLGVLTALSVALVTRGNLGRARGRVPARCRPC